ncbi:MAG: nitrilase-related carbon-nitrogen hydrolase [Candidatus Thorarchaeota archaeon]
MFRLAVGQMNPRIGDTRGNMIKMVSLLESAEKQDVDLIVLPECANSGYVFENREEVLSLSEEIPNGPFSKKLASWSKNGSMVIAGLVEKTPEGPYDSAVAFGNGKHLATYRKIHLFGKEKEWFLPGNKEPQLIEFNEYRFGVIICFDWAFPELSRILSLKGAQILAHPANLLLSYSNRAMITRSIENHIFTATSSRVGEDRGLRFIGGSQVTDPRGHILFRMDYEEEGVAWVDIEPSAADSKIIRGNDIVKDANVLVDRRPDLYGRITEPE